MISRLARDIQPHACVESHVKETIFDNDYE